MKTSETIVPAFLLAAGLLGNTAAAVNIDLVTVRNPGNPVDIRFGGYGGVEYLYHIGKFEITAAQYTEFLNAVARTDTYGLYNPRMADTAPGTYGYGCNIQRTGSPGDYSYSVPSAYANRPVNYVGFWDACRFANWMNNGQPTTGVQDASTTEVGSYTLNGYNDTDGRTIQRNLNARWVVPTQDEWYKAAYHKNDGLTNHYWIFPTSSDSVNTNMANYNMSVGHTTDVGTYSSYPSPYGTFDQGGNVYEWNESLNTFDMISRRMQGSSFILLSTDALSGAYRQYLNPTLEIRSIGFRIAYIPEPATLGLMAVSCFGILLRQNRFCRIPAQEFGSRNRERKVQ